jgi:uncharacterized protein
MSAEAVATDQVVVVTATAGYRHESIATAEQVIRDLAHRLAFNVVFAHTEAAMHDALSADALRRVKLVMFVNTTGELQLDGRDDLLSWIAGGGSFVGVHAAADTWHRWPQYIAMLGAEFDHHPQEETRRTIFVESGPAMANHELLEEFYLFKHFDRQRVSVLLALHQDPEDSRPGFFPLAWTRTYGKGRVFYTALGHRDDVWQSLWFQEHLTRGIEWALHR